MAHRRSQYDSNPTQTGHPARQTDEYGNPIRQTGTMGEYGTTGAGPGGTGTGTTGAGTYGTGTGTTGAHGYGGGVGTGHHEGKEHHGLGDGVLHRSGSSSSSSSSEDDGQGGRRKKGLKEKIKEKLPGTGHKDQTHSHEAATTTTPGLHGYGTASEHPEKKGVMEKIKEKLPGGGGGAHH